MKRLPVFLLALALLLFAGSAPAGAIHPSMNGGVAAISSYSSVAIPDTVQQKLAAKGNKVSQHIPASLRNGPHAMNPGAGLDAAPDVTGEQKAIALYLRFPANDQPPAAVSYAHMPVSQLQDLLFGTSYNPYTMEQFQQYASYNGIAAPTDRTLKNYYLGVSDGKVNVTGQVVEVTMPHGYSYYAIGNQYGLGIQNDYGDYTMSLIFEDAIAAADGAVDFSEYAKDGTVDNIFLIHEGTGAEFSTDPVVIWSHSWDYVSAYYYNRYALTGREDEDGLPGDGMGMLVDGVYVNNYSIEPEIGGDITAFLGAVDGPYPPYVGVYAHEFGHVLGVPDQYDYGYDSSGTGAYTLMAGGSWTRYPNAWQYAGNSPVYLDAWSLAYLGLQSPNTLTGTASYTLKPMADGGGIVKIIVPGSNGSEYFLIENRQQKGFDSALIRYGAGVHGLAIYHVDENVLERHFSRPNEAANWFQSRKQGVIADPATGETHYGISILQADNRWDLEKNVNNADGGDLYKAGQAFTPTSAPNSGSYYFNNGKGAAANYTGVFVKNIKENADGSVTFTAGIESR